MNGDRLYESIVEKRRVYDIGEHPRQTIIARIGTDDELSGRSGMVWSDRYRS
jgi:hypothetical protein